MNMTKCKTCGKDISPRAKRCPYCGEMTTRELIYQIILGIIIAPFIGIAVLIAIGFYMGWFGWFL